MINSRVNFLVKIPIRCWQLEILTKHGRGLLLFAAPCSTFDAISSDSQVATRYPGTRSGPGYPGIFITRLLSTEHCRLDCKFGVIDNKYHKSTANVRANCKYNCTTHHWLACYGVAYTAYLLITQDMRHHLARLRERLTLHVVFIIERCVQVIYKETRW